MLDLPGYRVVEELPRSGATARYRGLRDADGIAVSILAAEAGSEEADHLVREYEVAAQLTIRGVARPLHCQNQGGRVALVRAECGGLPLDEMVPAGGMPLTAALRTAAAAARILDELHGCQRLHLGLTPDAILVGPSGQAYLTDFGRAAVLPLAAGAARPLPGNPAYMAPEQTGRTGGEVGPGADLYALGMVLFQLLTGELPFRVKDPVEWFHCHIARTPAPPSTLNPIIPPAVDQVVLRLLSKTPEDRYRSASGLAWDLVECAGRIDAGGDWEGFRHGSRDGVPALAIPARLYGRGAERGALLDAWRRAAAGRAGLMLVAGHAGLGKTALVQELQPEVARRDGHFIAGKFDERNRATPYSCLIQALRELVRQVLAEPDEQLAHWRDKLRAALGGNGRVIVDAFPLAELVIGPQPPLQELPPAETKIRFQRTLRDFICAFAGRGRPLAIFLDDLQWADGASLELLSYLLCDPDIRHLLVVGTYRDNEVDAAHPLNTALQGMAAAGVPVATLTLAPLKDDDVAALVADTLGRTDAAELENLVKARTAGNPLFMRQFLLNLCGEGLLAYDRATGRWTWDRLRIEASDLGNDIAELMAQRLRRLSAPAQRALQVAACIGNRFAVGTLAVAAGRSEDEAAAALAESSREGLTTAADEGVFRFSHDRIQQAAYAMLTEAERTALHLAAGRALLADPGQADAVFDIANQFQHGVEQITDRAERQRLAAIYLQAGARAKAAAANQAARAYLTTGAEFAGADLWQTDHGLAMQLYTALAECEFLCGRAEVAGTLFEEVLRYARDACDIARIHVLRMHLHMSQGRSDQALEAGFQGLRRLDVRLSAAPAKGVLLAELARIAVGLLGRRIEDLADLPPMSDPHQQAVMHLYMNMTVAAYFVNRDLLALIAMRMVSLSMGHGNTGSSAYAYVTLGMVLGGGLGRYRDGFRFGELGRRLGEASGDVRAQGLSLSMCGIFTGAWGQPLDTSVAQLRQAGRDLLACGNLMMANYCAIAGIYALDDKGEDLPAVALDAQRQGEFVGKIGFHESVHYFRSTQRKVACLQGLTDGPGRLGGPGYDEGRHLSVLRRLKEQTALAWHLANRLQVAYLFGQYEEAKAAADELEAMAEVSIAQLYVPRQLFYAALVELALVSGKGEAARRGHLRTARRYHRRLRALAASCPDNYRHLDLLVAAEYAAATRNATAWRYDQAVKAAAASGHTQDWALANERTAAYFLRQGIESAAGQYLRDAWRGYRRWGAAALAQALERRYPRVIGAELGGAPPEAAPIDMAAVIEASQALSGEIEFGGLRRRLMEALASHAGAVRVVFILKRETGLVIEDEWRAGDDLPHCAGPMPLELCVDIAHTVVQYAAHTRSDVVIDDAARSGDFAADGYLAASGQRSLLCLAIARHGSLLGLLYMENPLLPGAFHRERLRVLHLLAAQLAISLENVELITGLKETEAALRESQSNLGRAQGIAHVGNWEWRMAENRTFWSDEMYRIFGLPVPRAEADHWTSNGYQRFMDAVHPEDREAVSRLLASAGVDGAEESYSAEFRIVRPDGGIRFVNEVGELQRDGQNQPYRIIGIVQDVTERKQLENLQARRQRELEHVARLNIIGEMASGLAHELSQPLSATQNYLRGCIRRLKSRELDQDTLLDVLSLASTQTERAADIISHVKDFVRKREPLQCLLDIRQVTHEVLTLLEQELRRNQVAVTIDFPQRTSLKVIADKVELEQVMVNLIKNAAEAMQASEGKRLAILATRDGDMLRVDIADSGPGIPEALRHEIFQPFFTTKPGGMGLGLSISHGIIESQGGRLWASPSPWGGTTFHFTLPLEDG